MIKFTGKLGCILTASLLIAAVAPAANTSGDTSITAPKWLFSRLFENFPEFFSKEGDYPVGIDLKRLECSSELTKNERGLPLVQSECQASNQKDEVSQVPMGDGVDSDAVDRLFLTLLNAGLPSTTANGTTHFSLEQVKCSVTPSSTPSTQIKAEDNMFNYNCSSRPGDNKTHR